ncbi:hypothetical protein [Candidatus Harpocratesius sp.]
MKEIMKSFLTKVRHFKTHTNKFHRQNAKNSSYPIDPLEIPIQQEIFLEDLRKFQKQVYLIENEITSYSPIAKDIINLKQYKCILKDFKHVINKRLKEIRKLIKRFQSFQSNSLHILENNSPYHYFSFSK